MKISRIFKAATAVTVAAIAIENSGGKVTVLSMPNYDNFDADAAKLVDKM